MKASQALRQFSNQVASPILAAEQLSLANESFTPRALLDTEFDELTLELLETKQAMAYPYFGNSMRELGAVPTDLVKSLVKDKIWPIHFKQLKDIMFGHGRKNILGGGMGAFVNEDAYEQPTEPGWIISHNQEEHRDKGTLTGTQVVNGSILAQSSMGTRFDLTYLNPEKTPNPIPPSRELPIEAQGVYLGTSSYLKTFGRITVGFTKSYGIFLTHAELMTSKAVNALGWLIPSKKITS